MALDSVRDEFLLGEFERVEEGAHGRFAVTPSALTFALVVVLVKPRIEIGLQGVDRCVDLLVEGDSIELVEHGLGAGLAISLTGKEAALSRDPS
ncbi:hypothetical protein BC427_04915 [Ralstonia solanacearum FJAT-91]|nr:hypothetical protein BC427_04915 [Ralstonia solanacearum FJAT-91]QIK17147.1 hypothetical protein G7968_01145 [Ralstonia solanacearum]BEU65723.1 hypothetical protein MAFF301069_02780 [Ralstonia pseudosolanacearum]QKZ28530.1 hypothetical protein HWE45_12970 [Ralstonia solanacearum]QKZ33497.1 hypothetical protein HWE47_12960 [Ralstonia solanacearum]